MEVAVDNVIGVVGWIAIIAAIVRYRGRRKAARTAQQETALPRPTVGRREAEIHPDLGAGLALGYAITEMHHGDPGAAHLGHIATAAYWASELTDSEPDDDDDDDLE
jgi:hypothetical protein